MTASDHYPKFFRNESSFIRLWLFIFTVAVQTPFLQGSVEIELNRRGLYSLTHDSAIWSNHQFVFKPLTEPRGGFVFQATLQKPDNSTYQTSSRDLSPEQITINPETNTVSYSFAWGEVLFRVVSLSNSLDAVLKIEYSDSQDVLLDFSWQFLEIDFPGNGPDGWSEGHIPSTNPLINNEYYIADFGVGNVVALSANGFDLPLSFSYSEIPSDSGNPYAVVFETLDEFQGLKQGETARIALGLFFLSGYRIPEAVENSVDLFQRRVASDYGLPDLVVEFTDEGIGSFQVKGLGVDKFEFSRRSGETFLSTLRASVGFLGTDGKLDLKTTFDSNDFSYGEAEKENQIIIDFEIAEVSVDYLLERNKIKFNICIENHDLTRSISQYGTTLVSFVFPEAPENWVKTLTPRPYTANDAPFVEAEFPWGRILMAAVVNGELAEVGYTPSSEENFFNLGLKTGEDALPIEPGDKRVFELELVFLPTGVEDESLKNKADQGFRELNKKTFVWKDRRPISMNFLASAAAIHRSETNPRGWFTEPTIDVFTDEGLLDFRNRLIQRAEILVERLAEMNAQGVITWDIEGQEFDHPVTFIGDPTIAETLSPELAWKPSPEALSNIDAYFKVFEEAGINYGVTIRPMRFGYFENGQATQFNQTREEALEDLKNKVQFAVDRWGCNMFYIDTNATLKLIQIEGDPFPLELMPAYILEELHNEFPNVLFAPELGHPTAHYAYSVPYGELDLGITSTPEKIREVYASAFSLINITDGDVEGNYQNLLNAIIRGDVLLFRGWFNDSLNETVMQLYKEKENFYIENWMPNWAGMYFSYEGDFENWVYHANAGWTYIILGLELESAWFYIPQTGWVWSRGDLFPYFWHVKRGWCYLADEILSPSWLYFFDEENWESLGVEE